MKEDIKSIFKEMVFGDFFGFLWFFSQIFLGISAIVALILVICGISIPYPNEW